MASCVRQHGFVIDGVSRRQNANSCGDIPIPWRKYYQLSRSPVRASLTNGAAARLTGSEIGGVGHYSSKVSVNEILHRHGAFDLDYLQNWRCTEHGEPSHV